MSRFILERDVEMARSFLKTILAFILVSFVCVGVSFGAIRFVEQVSDKRRLFCDIGLLGVAAGESLYSIEAAAGIYDMSITFGPWALWRKGMGKRVESKELKFRSDDEYRKLVSIYVVPGDGWEYRVEERLIDGVEMAGVRPVFGAIRLAWLVIPAGCGDLGKVDVFVRRSVKKRSERR